MAVAVLRRTGFEDVVTERLEADICELFGQLSAGTARVVLMIAEFDHREAWAQWGCRSAAHWLSWKCGIGMHAAREKLRVGHALAVLPIARAAFERGELSYSQVRSITRVAGPHNEARASSTSPGRRPRNNSTVSSPPSRKRTRSGTRASPRRNSRSGRFGPGSTTTRDMYTARLRLMSDDGRIVTQALKLAAKQLKAERGDQGPDTTPEQLLADALVAIASSFLHTHLTEGTGTDDYRAVVYADHTIIDPDATTHDCGLPLQHRHRLVGTVRPPVRDAPRAHLQDGAMLTAETIRRIWCDTTVTRVEQRDGTITVIEEPTRTISAALRRALKLRDTQCRFPGCNAKRVDAHHIRYRSHNGPTTLTNLLSLCRFHHKLVHEGGYRVTRSADGDIRFHDPHGRQLHYGTNLTANNGADALRATHQHLGINIEPDTITGTHCGDKLDMHYAVSVLTKQNAPGSTCAKTAPAPPQGRR